MMDYVVARSGVEVIAAVADFGGKARLIAGGTALQLGWPEGRADCPLVDIMPVDMGPPVSMTVDGALRLAANATLENIRLDPLVQDKLPVLSDAIGDVAALGVRNLATIGGNLCWRAGDLIPLLLVLGARVVSLDRETCAIENWLEQADSGLVLAIEVPVPFKESVVWEKVGHRTAFSPSLITVAAVLDPAHAGELARVRLAVGGGPTPPARLHRAEAQIRAMAATDFSFENLARHIAAAVRSASDLGGTAAHRASVAGRVLAHGIIGVSALRRASA